MVDKEPLFKHSRQYEWQRRMMAQGRCTICGKPAITARYCEFHREKYNGRRRDKTGYKPWRLGGRGRPPIGRKEI